MLSSPRKALGSLLRRSKLQIREARETRRSHEQLREFHQVAPAPVRPLPPDVMRAFRELWHEQLGLTISPRWHELYASTSGIVDHRYITREVFVLHVYKALNDGRLAPAYSDKNNLDRLFPDVERPCVVLRRIHGRFYSRRYDSVVKPTRYLLNHDGTEVVVKPALGSSGGRGIEFFRIRGDRFVHGERSFTVDDLVDQYGSNFVVEEALKQHDYLSKIYPQSINTIRVTTLRSERGIGTISAVVRFGVGGKRVDNQGAGGIAVGVRRDGAFNAFAVDKLGRRHAQHPNTSFTFEGARLPFMERTFAMCEELHACMLSFDLISWDVALTDEGMPTLVEMNLGNQEINFHQLNNGPLFGDQTEEVMHRVMSVP